MIGTWLWQPGRHCKEIELSNLHTVQFSDPHISSNDLIPFLNFCMSSLDGKIGSHKCNAGLCICKSKTDCPSGAPGCSNTSVDLVYTSVEMMLGFCEG